MSMADLVSAGAPELPYGWFYRVRDDSFGGLLVEVRSNRKRFGSRLRATAYVREDEASALLGIVGACCHAVQVVKEELGHRSYMHEASWYLGDHDPKGGRQ